VTLRLDVLTRDVAGFRNDFGHFIERGGHRACSFLDGAKRYRRNDGANKPDRSGPLRS
jgi:hypothetical protein